MNEVKKVPRLRFPGFVGEWKETKLGEISIWASGGTPAKDNENYWNGDIPWISASSMRGIEYYDSELKITDTGLARGSKLATKGSLLILVRGSMLFNTIPIGIATRDVAFNQDVKSIKVIGANHAKYILYWLIASENQLMSMVSGTGIGAGKLDLHELKNLQILLPTLPEQQKIASFLTVLDTRLQQLQRKKALLEQYKKGLMQQIFSRKIRFRDEEGKEFGAWEEKRLGEISTDVMYGMNSAATDYDGVNKYLRITDIDDESRMFSPKPLSSPDGALEEKYRLKEGDIVFARTGASTGKSYLYKKEDGILFFAGFLIKFSIIKAIPYFIYIQTFSTSYQKWVGMMSMRSGQPGINAEEYRSLKLLISSIAEQQKIATFLTALDAKIAHVTAQITLTQTFKKGLLQQMFV